MGQEIEGDVLGGAYKGYVFKLAGGNDKDGFPMKQGIMINGRTRMLFKSGRKYSFSLLKYLIITIVDYLCRCYNLQTAQNW